MTLHRLITLKWIDIIGQVACVVLTPMVVLIDPDAGAAGFFGIYLTLGGWQTCSAVISLFVSGNTNRWKSPIRTAYNVLLLFSAGLLGYMVINKDIGPGLVILIVTPLMALLYIILSCVELRNLRRLQSNANTISIAD